MNARPSRITGTSAPLSDPRKPERACVPQSLNQLNANRKAVDAATIVPGKPVAGHVTSSGVPTGYEHTGTAGETAPLPDDGWGNQPRCITCRKGMSNCLCDAPDIDVPSVTDMKRIMPSLFEERGWALAEHSAYGMAVKL